MASTPQDESENSDGGLVDTQDSSQDVDTCSLQKVESSSSILVEKLAVSSHPKPRKSTDAVSAKWSKRNVHKLIELHKKYESMFAKPKIKKKYVWGLIAVHLVEDGFQVTAERAEQKWKNITKTYRDTIDFNYKGGNPTKQCPFFKELQDAYDYKPNLYPRVMGSIGSSSDFNTLTSSNKLELGEMRDVDTASSSEDGSNLVKAKKLKTRHTKNSTIIDLLEDLKTEMTKQHEVLIQVLNKQHKDRMDNESKKLELIAELVESVKK